MNAIVVSPSKQSDVRDAMIEFHGIQSHSTIWSSLIRAVRVITSQDIDPLDFPWHNMELSHLRMLVVRMKERFAPRTINHTISSVRQVMYHLLSKGLISHETYLFIQKFKGIRDDGRETGRAISAEEQAKLLAAAPDLRAKAIVHLLLWGLRRVEVCRLDKASVSPAPNGANVRVLGKGMKYRIVPLRGAAADDVLAHARTVRNGPLFVGHRFHEETGRLSTRGVSGIFDDVAAAAGVGDISTHDMRRTSVTIMHDAGVSLADIALFHGHSSPTTTMRYIKEREVGATNNAAADKRMGYTGG